MSAGVSTTNEACNETQQSVTPLSAAVLTPEVPAHRTKAKRTFVKCKNCDYECPRCGYSTNKKHCIESHFGRKGMCREINDIELTDEVKKYVLANRVYKVKVTAPKPRPKPQPNIVIYNNYNLFVTSLDYPNKAEQWVKYKLEKDNERCRIRNLQEHVQEGLYNEGFDAEHLTSIWNGACTAMTNDNRQNMVQNMMTKSKGSYMGISDDSQSKNFSVKDGEIWIRLEERMGMRRIIQEYQEEFLNLYEAYTIHKLFHHTSHRERQACSKRLFEHFQFLAAFEC